MQISKLLPAVALATLCASLPTVHAADNPAQAAARKALEQKIANPNAPASVPAPKPAKKPAPALISKPAPAPKPTLAPAPVRAAAPVVKAEQPKVPAPASKVAVKVAPTNANGDTPAQAAARQALAKKLFETGTPTPAVQTPVAAISAKPVVKPVVATATPIAAAPVVASTAAPVNANGDTPAQAAARQALAPKLSVPAAPTPAVQIPVAAIPAKPVVATVPPAAVTPVVASTVASVNANGDTPAQAAARQALAKKLFEAGTATPVAVVPPPAAMPAEKPASPTTCQASATCCMAAPTNTNGDTPAQAAARQALAQKLATAAPVAGTVETPKPKLGKDELPPIPAPVSPLPATKEAKLEALLLQYQADLISPAEYHKQRAAILAQP